MAPTSTRRDVGDKILTAHGTRARKRPSIDRNETKTPVPVAREPALPTYEKALRALAAAKNTDDVLKIKNVAEAMRAYARQASDRTMQVDAVEIIIRSERKLGLLIDQQRNTEGLAKGGGDQRSKHRGAQRPGGPVTYKEAGIKRYLAKAANRLASIPETDFQRLLEEWRREMGNASRVTRLMRYQYNKEVEERREAEALAREKEEWIKKRKGDEISREELGVEWEKSQAAFFDEDDDFTSAKRWTARQMWEARLVSNPCVPDGPKTLSSVHKIVADAITRLLALASARSVKHAPTAADYEKVLEQMDRRIDDLYEALEKSNSVQH